MKISVKNIFKPKNKSTQDKTIANTKYIIEKTLLSLNPKKYRGKIKYWIARNKYSVITCSKDYVMIPVDYADTELIRDSFYIGKWLMENPRSIAIFIKIRENNIGFTGKQALYWNTSLFKPSIISWLNTKWFVNELFRHEQTIIIDGEAKPITLKSPLQYAILKYPSKNTYIAFIRE